MTTTRDTWLYLDGVKAYVRRYGIASPHVSKGDFESLITKNDDEITVIICKSIASKYARRINLLGYVLTDQTDYDSTTYKLVYKAINLI